MDSRTLLREAIAALHRAGIPDPRLDAELILAEATGLTRTQFLTSPPALTGPHLSRFRQMLDARAQRMPLAYILGRREFYSLELKVNPEVLIPRPETETLVTAALEFINRRRDDVRILDLGTGSGAIAIALAFYAPSAVIVATDISPSALAVARANADSFGLSSRITFILADCWLPLESAASLGRFGLIVSNPPYIAEAELDALEPEVREYEPRIALTPGTDSLSFYRRIAAGLADHLAPDGSLMLEIGCDQAQAVGEIVRGAGLAKFTLINDLAGLPRVLHAELTTEFAQQS